MALNFGGNLFDQKTIFDDEGRAITITDMEHSGRIRTQILRHTEMNQNTTTTFYTVPSGKVFFLTNANACISMVSGTTETGVQIQGDADGVIRILLKIGVAAFAGGQTFPTATQSHSYVPPIKFPAGKVIQINTGGGDLRGYGNIQGWEENA